MNDEPRYEPISKSRSDGKCGMCPRPVPPYMPNKFYCSWACADQAQAFYRAREEAP
jgi:hypothetical protein